MDTIELWSGTTKALVDPIGAWLTNLSDEYGHVLYPKRKLINTDGDSKLRGGCHICLPNFGPGGDSGQPQHGFGREMVWSVIESTRASATLELAQGRDGYKALQSQITYTVAEGAVDIRLVLTNTGTKPLRIGPAFHPYFALSNAENEVRLNGTTYDTGHLADTEFFSDKQSMSLQTEHRTVIVKSVGLPTWAFWTDRLGEYVCIEPTHDGYSFLKKPTSNEMLSPAQGVEYGFSISW